MLSLSLWSSLRPDKKHMRVCKEGNRENYRNDEEKAS